ncbi:hypothetical protein ACFLZ2_03805 [Candidatus Margulisiibacteriota bacterium]
MKRIILVILAVLLLNCLSVTAFAYDYYHKVDVEYTEVPYRPVYAFLGVHFEGGNQQSGAGLTLMSARERDIQLNMMVGYRSFSNTGSFDILIGGAYFPRRPTFVLGDMPVRLKIYAMGGMGMANDIFFAMMGGAELVFSSADEPSGLTMGMAFWPAVNVGTTTNIPSSMSFRIGFLFAPD